MLGYKIYFNGDKFVADNTGTEWYKTRKEAEATMDKLKGIDNKDIERD